MKTPARRRPIAKNYIGLARSVGFAAGVSAGASFGVGTMPDALAAGGLNIALPIIGALVLMIGLGAFWHNLYHYAAHARETHERSIALGFGGGGFLIGASCTAWFLAGILGGPSALNEYKHGYVARDQAAIELASADAALDDNVVVALKTAENNLDATASGECDSGVVSGRRGKGVICAALKNSAGGMTALRGSLAKQQQERDNALSRARDALTDAVRDISTGDDTAFRDDAARAVAETRAGAKIRLGVASLNIGIAAPAEALHTIDETASGIAAVMADINMRRRAVTVPDYQPIDAKKAMLTNPQPLAWLAALVIEALPLLMLGLLLTIWRDEEGDDKDGGSGGSANNAKDDPEPVLDMRRIRRPPYPMAAE
jgi:hypothetical protein